MTRPTFNLIDEPWIGAVNHEGTLQEYSLSELLIRAHELSGLYDNSPLVVATLLRIILALLHRVHDGPRNRSEWQALWQARQFDASQLDAYFDKWRDRFDLFDREHPFYQTIDAGSDGQEKLISTPSLLLGTMLPFSIIPLMQMTSRFRAQKLLAPWLQPSRSGGALQSKVEALLHRWYERPRHHFYGRGQLALRDADAKSDRVPFAQILWQRNERSTGMGDGQSVSSRSGNTLGLCGLHDMAEPSCPADTAAKRHRCRGAHDGLDPWPKVGSQRNGPRSDEALPHRR